MAGKDAAKAIQDALVEGIEKYGRLREGEVAKQASDAKHKEMMDALRGQKAEMEEMRNELDGIAEGRTNGEAAGIDVEKLEGVGLSQKEEVGEGEDLNNSQAADVDVANSIEAAQSVDIPTEGLGM